MENLEESVWNQESKDKSSMFFNKKLGCSSQMQLSQVISIVGFFLHLCFLLCHSRARMGDSHINWLLSPKLGHLLHITQVPFYYYLSINHFSACGH